VPERASTFSVRPVQIILAYDVVTVEHAAVLTPVRLMSWKIRFQDLRGQWRLATASMRRALYIAPNVIRVQIEGFANPQKGSHAHNRGPKPPFSGSLLVTIVSEIIHCHEHDFGPQATFRRFAPALRFRVHRSFSLF
jgi:hypothetical protein